MSVLGKKRGSVWRRSPSHPTADRSIWLTSTSRPTQREIRRDRRIGKSANYSNDARPNVRGTTHCTCCEGGEIKNVTEPFRRAIALPWMVENPLSGRIKLSWEAQQEDGSWKRETATLHRGEKHPLLELCRKSVADHERRTRDTKLDS